MNMFKKIIRVVLPLLIIVMAVGVTRRLIKSRPKAKKKARTVQAPLVKVKTLEAKAAQVEVRAQGSVIPAREVVLQPQVNGRLYSVDDQLVVGGLLKKNQIVARIERRDYQLTLKERKTAIEDARARLAIEKGQQVIAKKEWALFNKGKANTFDASLALRKPQLKTSELAIESAQLRLQRAQLDLSRTTIKVPFNAIVRAESAEVGQLVNTQSRLATLVGTDVFWIQAAVPLKHLPDLQIPGFNATEGSNVTVVQAFGEKEVKRQGKVVRLLGELDTVGRMAQVIVEVKDPLNREKANQALAVPLLLGSYVDVTFSAGQKANLISIPRTSLHDGNNVYIVKDGKLEIRKVEIAWRRIDSVLVNKGVQAGEQLVVSRLVAPVNGMKLRVEGSVSQDASKPPKGKTQRGKP